MKRDPSPHGADGLGVGDEPRRGPGLSPGAFAVLPYCDGREHVTVEKRDAFLWGCPVRSGGGRDTAEGKGLPDPCGASGKQGVSNVFVGGPCWIWKTVWAFSTGRDEPAQEAVTARAETRRGGVANVFGGPGDRRVRME